MCLVHLVNITTPGGLSGLGIVPRSVEGSFGILIAPFIHASAAHLVSNLVALCFFTAISLLRSVKFYLVSSAFIIIVSGCLVWLLGRSASHVGASGWVFGLWSLSLAMAWFDRRLINMLLALLVWLLYGGMVYGVLPTDSHVSYEAHFFGAVAGILFAYIYSQLGVKQKNKG
ncbi:rhomboid family intramembrane serine protease [Sinobacterium caligoides]|nr:rhomboid family intramembrane serine protease [Sinobacterium caligoides]